MTLLSIVQKAAVACGMTAPAGVVSNPDQNIQQMLGLAQFEGDETAAFADWRNLKVGISITGDGSSTLFQLPPDFDRWPANPAFFLASYPLAPLAGPIPDEDMLALQALPATIWPPVWNMVGGVLQVWPPIGASDVLTSQYRSSNWVLSGGDGLSRLPAWASDTDSALIPERIVAMGVIWRWKEAKGLDFGSYQDRWAAERDKLAGHDRGTRIVRMSNLPSGPGTYPGRFTDSSDAGVSGQFT